MKKLIEKTNYEIQSELGIAMSDCFITNISDEETTIRKIRASYNVLAKTVARTLGPYGRNTILQGTQEKNLISKDGFDVYKRIKFNQDVPQTVMELIKEAVSHQANKAGDGTTSAVVLGNALYQRIISNKEIFGKMAPKDVTDIIQIIIDHIIEEIVTTSNKLSLDSKEISWIASTSLNNDTEGGKFIHEVFKELGTDGFISTDVKPYVQSKDFLEAVTGFQIGRGYISNIWSDLYENKAGKVVSENVKVLLCNGTLLNNHIKGFIEPLIKETCLQEGKELWILACDFSKDVKGYLESVRTAHRKTPSFPEAKFVITDIDQVKESSINLLKDLSVGLGIEIFDPMRDPESAPLIYRSRFIGESPKIEVTKNSTNVIIPIDFKKEELNVKRAEYIKSLEIKYREMELKQDISELDFNRMIDLKDRINRFKKTSGVIYAGGETLAERLSRERLLEDAVKAVGNGLKDGYIYGGCLAAPRILHDIIKISSSQEKVVSNIMPKIQDFSWVQYKHINTIIEILYDAFSEVYRSVLDNSNLDQKSISSILKLCLEHNAFYNLKDRKFYFLNKQAKDINVFNQLRNKMIEDIKLTYPANELLEIMNYIPDTYEECKVINPATTDVEILRSCVSIVKLMINSNQIITQNLIDDRFSSRLETK